MSLQGFRTPMTNCKRFEYVVVSRCTFKNYWVYLYQIKYMYVGSVEEEDVYNAHFMTPTQLNSCFSSKILSTSGHLADKPNIKLY